jgi:hypothetical protein
MTFGQGSAVGRIISGSFRLSEWQGKIQQNSAKLAEMICVFSRCFHDKHSKKIHISTSASSPQHSVAPHYNLPRHRHYLLLQSWILYIRPLKSKLSPFDQVDVMLQPISG